MTYSKNHADYASVLLKELAGEHQQLTVAVISAGRDLKSQLAAATLNRDLGLPQALGHEQAVQKCDSLLQPVLERLKRQDELIRQLMTWVEQSR